MCLWCLGICVCGVVCLWCRVSVVCLKNSCGNDNACLKISMAFVYIDIVRLYHFTAMHVNQVIVYHV